MVQLWHEFHTVRRSLNELEQAVAAAKNRRAKALAHYRLGVFHDNNSREASAIPHYRRAIALGLDASTEACALAWLASSLHKTGSRPAAMRCVKRVLAGRCPRNLRGFLMRLRSRIDRASDARS